MKEIKRVPVFLKHSVYTFIYVYSPQEQTRTTEKIDRDRKKIEKTYKLNVQYKH